MEYLITPKNMDRRIFIKGLGLVSVSLILGTLGCSEDLAEAIRNRPIRRRLRTGSAEVDADIATYREAVRLMKELTVNHPTDPRGWNKQAEIHGTVAGGFNLCQHNTDHFFSWHRAYLSYFEKICQKLTNNQKFGLPYWNWNQNTVIHPEYLNSNSPLFSPRNNTDATNLLAVSTSILNP